MKVLIVSTNRNQNPVTVMPYGACVVAEACRDAGHQVKVLDLMFEESQAEALGEALKQFEPDIVGISIRNIDNNNFKSPVSFIHGHVELINKVRKESRAKVILGGAALGIMPEEFLRYTGADFAVTGYGEFVMPLLLKTLETGGSFDVPGLSYIDNGAYVKNDFSAIPPAYESKVPDFSRWIDVKAYQRNLSSFPLQTKRGCPYKCIYCTYSKNEGTRYQLFSPESVADSVEKLAGKGFRDIEFVDNVFNSPREHALEVCREIKRRGIKARFIAMSINPRFLNDELLTLMEEIGFAGIGITAESASDEVLCLLGKEYFAVDLCKAAILVAKHSIPCFWMFMLGGPGENKETVIKTLEFAGRYIQPSDIAFFNTGIRVYPETELEKTARAEGLIKTEKLDLLNSVFYTSPGLDPQWVASTVKDYMKKHFNFIDSDSMGFGSLPSIYKLGYMLGFRPPLWRHMPGIISKLRFMGVNV